MRIDVCVVEVDRVYRLRDPADVVSDADNESTRSGAVVEYDDCLRGS